MKTHIEVLSLIKRRITVTIPAATMDVALANALTKAIKDETYTKKLSRKAAQTGKLSNLKTKEAPQEFIKYNFQQLAPGVIEKFMQTTIVKELQQKQLITISELNLETAEKNTHGDIKLVVTFDVMPDPNEININIPAFTMDPIVVTEDEINNTIKQLRLQHVQWRESHNAIQLINKVIIDLQGEMQGKTFPEGQADDMEIALGMDTMMPGFQEQLIGLQRGARKTFDLVYPLDYPDTHLAGKLATFTVVVKKIYEPELPPIDEKLIKDCGVASGKLEDLIQKINQNLLQQKTIMAKHQLKEKVFDLLLQQNPFAIPQKMLEQEEQQRINHPSDHRIDPERTVRLSLLVSSLLQKFNLTPDPIQVKQCIEEFVNIYKDAEQMKKSIYADANQLAEFQMLALEDQLVEKLLQLSLLKAQE